MYPAIVHATGGKPFRGNEQSTSSFYGVVLRGRPFLKVDTGLEARLCDGSYFCVSSPFSIEGDGEILMIEKIGFRCLDQVGGPIENAGRLTYIDYCRSSVLISPPRVGDPVLNLLTFPPGIHQTEHIHPTYRIGLVTGGSGICHYGAGEKQKLVPGMAFILPEGLAHCFQSGAQGLTVVAFHPDSDVGPSDEQNPMLSRTYIQR